MSATSVGRIVVACFALAAACGATLFVGIQMRREPPVEAEPASAATAILSPLNRDEGSGALATAQAAANAMAPAPAASPRSAEADDSVPVFDIARIEQTGEAVIAGRTAPGAIVELLRGVEPFDRAVADESGQFVMVPPLLPRGDYELTLRSTQPGGKQATSKQSVVVALSDLEPSTGSDRSRAEETATASHSVPDKALGRQGSAVSQPPHAAAVLLSDGGSLASVVVPKSASTVVSRGDSLWRISRTNYGAGLRYAVIYKANRDQIRNPNRIYPGQIFVLPMKERENGDAP